MRRFFILLLLPSQVFAQNPPGEEVARWEKQAQQVTIIRDEWGIPHIYGKTDADAVFGLMYAQCEDDFRRVEMNYVEKLGYTARIKGKSHLYDDLLMRLVIDSNDARADYRNAPAWLKRLCDAFADGINFYLYKHPSVTPALLHRFEPWYPLLWTDGSIGAINTAGITPEDVKGFYSNDSVSTTTIGPAGEKEMTGSNGFALAPSITESGHAILYINPHVTFYFRPEVHMVSGEGLNVYGAVTWGQFFVYQGFNEHCGWMHTSSQVDAADSYIERLSQEKGKWFYQYNGASKPVTTKRISISFSDDSGRQVSDTFTALFTHHGPVMAKKNGQFLSVRADNRIMNGLVQCWRRTKARSFGEFKETLDLLGNISNNTVYADAEGNIAYWHGNRVPRRDPRFDWSKPVDGTISATEWQGYHKVQETIHLYNPSNGWLQNCNSTPFSVAGKNSPKRKDYPAYMAPDPENFRAVNAVRVLDEEKHYTLDKVIKAGYDTRLTAFEVLVPALINSFEKSVRNGDSTYGSLLEPIRILREWDFRCGETSVATTLAVEWGQRILPAISRALVPGMDNAGLVEKSRQFAATAPASELLTPLKAAVSDLRNRFGRWQVPWGDINRFQRISAEIENKFDDNKPSIAVGYVSSLWGMLPSFTSRSFPGTKKKYGYSGNSFICAVEFGKRIKAKALLTGGENGDPASPHFFDQGLMYAKGEFRDVLFYKEDVLKHAERTYHPGQ